MRAIRRWLLTFELFVVLSCLYMFAAIDLVIIPAGFDDRAGYALGSSMVQQLGVVFGALAGLAFLVLDLTPFVGVFFASRWLARRLAPQLA
jgi:hypothetical protein